MVRIAVVEDMPYWSEKLSAFLDRYASENGEQVQKTFFTDGYDIAEDYKGGWDVILLDIKLALMDGMAAAEKIREKDEEVIIIFITSLPQYAIQGYRVNALDYLLKPIDYVAFSLTLSKALRRLPRKGEEFIAVSTRGGVVKLRWKDIAWIESQGHRITFHTSERDIETTVYSLKELEEKSEGKDFSRCNKGCLVNLAAVDSVENGFVRIGSASLPVSRGRKAEFMSALTSYIAK